MDDQRNDRNERNDRGFQRRNRFHRGGHGGGGGDRHGGHRQRMQRPLLTSAINGAGLSLVALAAAFQYRADFPDAVRFLGWAVLAFTLSSVISYFAQRLRPRFVELVSDLFFLAGAVLIILAANVFSPLFL